MRNQWQTKQLARRCVIALPFLLFLVSSGCKPSAKRAAEREAYLKHEVEQTSLRIQDYSYERQDEALVLVDEALANPRFAGHKPIFFAHKINLLLSLERVKEASDLVVEAWKKAPDQAQAVFGKICDFHQQRNAYREMNDWCTRLLDLGAAFPKELRGRLMLRRLTAALGIKDMEQARSDLDTLLTLVRPEESLPDLQRSLEWFIDMGNHREALVLLNHFEKAAAGQPSYQPLIVSLKLRCIVLTGEWGRVVEALAACVPQLPDAMLHQTLKNVFGALNKNNQTDLLQQAAKQILFNAVGKEASVHYAARVWVDTGMTVDKKVLAERLNVLLNVKVSPILVGDLYERYFYETIEDHNVVRNLCAVGERLLTVCTNEATVNMAKVKVLDGAFIVNDDNKANHMLEQGIPGKDKAWHDMSLPKVKAHRAMAQNKPREAVAYFRAFMNAWLATDQDEESDPTTGISHSREWILGRNAIRIARLLESIPDKEEADKAREEAKDYFRKALIKAENDPPALKLLKEEIRPLGL